MISGISGNTSIMAALQNMQKQMQALSTQATAKPFDNVVNPQVQIPKSPEIKPKDESSEASFSSMLEDAYADAVSMNEKKTEEISCGDKIGAFENMLGEAFDNVNILQNTSSDLQTRFDLGDRSVTLSDVMLASQKSGISFEATLQIRNKLLEAYRTISQMTV